MGMKFQNAMSLYCALQDSFYKKNVLAIVIIVFGLLFSSPTAAQDSSNKRQKKTEGQSSYAGKAYNCNGYWQPYPCAEEKPAPTQDNVKPAAEPLNEEEQQYRQKEMDKFVSRQKENLIAKTREYAVFSQKKYNITPKSLNDIEIYCRMQQTTIENCRKKLFDLEAEIATYEKEYRKNRGLPYVPNDRASKTLKNKPKRPEFKF